MGNPRAGVETYNSVEGTHDMKHVSLVFLLVAIVK